MGLELPFGAQAIGDVAGADQHDDNSARIVRLRQRLTGVPAHRCIPGDLRLVQAFELLRRHLAVQSIVRIEIGAEQLAVLGVGNVDAGRHARA